MEVTKENFSKAYMMLEKSLESADFIAIDGEFSGLSTIKQGKIGYDTLEEKYLKTRMGSSKILLIQYGISLFTWKEEKESYEALPFTFYIFPRPYKRYGNDVMFMSQSSSLDYLANNGFDFNKLFHHGISFMSPWEEKRAKERIEKEMSYLMAKEQSNSSSIVSNLPRESKVFIPKDQREFIDSVCETVKCFMKDQDKSDVDLPTCTPFQRKLIYEKLEEMYPLGLYLEAATNERNQKFIRGRKTAMGYGEIYNEKLQKEEEMLEEIVGFTKVMKLIAQSKKPIIGHNMLLDIFLTVTNFFSPPQLCFRDFKYYVRNMFPVIFDTKFIASSSPANQYVCGTGVQSLVDCIEDRKLPDPKVIISEDLKDEQFAMKYHQAGFDAYCTGRIFISLSKCVLSCLSQPSHRIDLTCDILNPYMNRVFILGIRDIMSTNLAGDDSTPDRRDVFYVRFPLSWRQSDIEALFAPYCSLSYPINWINEESAFVTLDDRNKINDVVANLVTKSSGEKSAFVLSYDDFMNNQYPRENISEINAVSKRKRKSNDVEDGELVESNDCAEKI